MKLNTASPVLLYTSCNLLYVFPHTHPVEEYSEYGLT